MIAEDNAVSRKLLEKTLLNAGYEVACVKNGLEALNLLKKRFFPIVLTDWVMPVMDGLDLCRAIRQTATPGYVFIVLLTAKDSRQDLITGLQAGADEYLTKPFDPAELNARLNTGKRILELERSLRKANEEIRILSITDPLTGCYNRSYLTERLPQEIKRARRFHHSLSIVLCDIDHFKKVNDRHGHQAGDMVLQEFVRLIQRSIRQGTDWLARYGGEEFLIVAPETDVDTACIMAERLRNIVCGHRVSLPSGEIRITATFGITGFAPDIPEGEISSEVLIKRADLLLYRAKQRGRNRICAASLVSCEG